MLREILKKSGLEFLKDVDFIEITPGRFFQKEKTNLGNGWKQFFVVLGSNVESPVHNHAGQNMEETHLLLYGAGKFIIYEKEGMRELVLKQGKFHEVFTTLKNTPDHKYVAGPEGSITLAVERLGPVLQ